MAEGESIPEISVDDLRRQEYARRLTEIFQQKNWEKLENLDTLLDKHKGKEHSLYCGIEFS